MSAQGADGEEAGEPIIAPLAAMSDVLAELALSLIEGALAIDPLDDIDEVEPVDGVDVVVGLPTGSVVVDLLQPLAHTAAAAITIASGVEVVNLISGLQVV